MSELRLKLYCNAHIMFVDFFFRVLCLEICVTPYPQRRANGRNKFDLKKEKFGK